MSESSVFKKLFMARLETPFITSKLHLPELDGLRGLAILGVLLAHFIRVSPANTDPVSLVLSSIGRYGWMGVDLFFVLSGFLITGILMETKGKQNGLINFYARRALRIAPLYYTYIFGILGALLIYRLVSGWNDQATRLATDCLWAIPYLTNIQISIGGTTVSSVINHFWSLAIEEQFYLIWPMVVLMTNRRQLVTLCCVVVVVACTARVVCIYNGYIAAGQMLMPCRADSLAIGALLAAACRSTRFLKLAHGLPLWSPALLAAPLALCALSGSAIGGLLAATALAVAFGGLLLYSISTTTESFIGKTLRSPFLLCCGKYSYGMYVLNQPIAFWPGNEALYSKFTESLGSPLAATLLYAILGIALTFTAAWLSWRLLESYFLKMKGRFA